MSNLASNSCPKKARTGVWSRNAQQVKSRRKQTMTGSWNNECKTMEGYSNETGKNELLEEKSNKTGEQAGEDGSGEAIICAFVCFIWSSLSCILLPQGEDDGEIIMIRMELESLKTRCGGYEEIIKDLESRCDTHERELEMLWQQIVCLHDAQGTLKTRYNEENYELIPYIRAQFAHLVHDFHQSICANFICLM
jgi:hypothetical protein